MKKFSWILALILALSVGFIGCPSGGDDDDTTSAPPPPPPPSNVAVTGVSVEPTSLTLDVGNTGTLTATVRPANATNKAVVWTSSDDSVATVSDAGVVTAVAAGSGVIITATTVDGGHTGAASVDVNDPSLNDLTGELSITPHNAKLGDTLTAVYNGSEAVIYQWKKGTTNVGDPASTTNKTYTPTEDGEYMVLISLTGYNGKSAVVVVTEDVPGGLEDILVKFGAAADKTKAYEKASPAGEILYVTEGEGFSYEYAKNTVTNSNYGNAIVRFRVDLEDNTLGDFGYIQFNWKAFGYKDDDSVANSKKLYLLASKTGGDLEGYQSDADIKALVINTTYFDDPSTIPPRPNGSSGDNFYSDALIPNVGGDVEQLVKIPIVKGKDLTGGVWFSIYVHAVKDKYQITNLKFVVGEEGTYSVTPEATDPAGTRPKPPEPDGVPYSFDLIVTKANSSDVGTTDGGLNATPVDITDETEGISAIFTENGQRLNIKLSADQLAILGTRVNSKIDVVIDGEVDGDDAGGAADSFRYHLLDITKGGGWNATGAGGPGKFEDILELTISFADGDSSKPNPNYFTIQHRANGTITLNIRKITLTTYLADAPAYFKSATGLKTGVGYYSNTGIDTGDSEFDSETGILTFKSGGFYVALPDGFTETDTVVIQYAAFMVQGTQLDVIKKQKDGWTDTDDSVNKCPTLNTSAVDTVEVNGFSEDGVTAGKAFFQMNNGPYIARIKIISVTIKE